MKVRTGGVKSAGGEVEGRCRRPGWKPSLVVRTSRERTGREMEAGHGGTAKKPPQGEFCREARVFSPLMHRNTSG